MTNRAESHATCPCSFFQEAQVCLHFPFSCGLGAVVASAFLFFFHVALTVLSFSRIHFFYSPNRVTLVADLTRHVLNVIMTHNSDEKYLLSPILPSPGRGGGQCGEGMGEILVFPNLLAGSIMSVMIIWCSA